MSVLKDLFNGEICPIESCVPKTEEYKRALQEMKGYGDVLEAGMTPEQKGLLADHLEAYSKAEKLVQEEVFRQAFLLGIRMQKEIDTKV